MPNKEVQIGKIVWFKEDFSPKGEKRWGFISNVSTKQYPHDVTITSFQAPIPIHTYSFGWKGTYWDIADE